MQDITQSPVQNSILYAIRKDGKYLSELSTDPPKFGALTPGNNAYKYSVKQVANDIARMYGGEVVPILPPIKTSEVTS
jgi:hypothetical protein